MDLQGLLSMLQAGGNAAMIGLFFLMWKFDRRLVRIETTLGLHLKDEDYLHKIIDYRIEQRERKN